MLHMEFVLDAKQFIFLKFLVIGYSISHLSFLLLDVYYSAWPNSIFTMRVLPFFLLNIMIHSSPTCLPKKKAALLPVRVKN